MLKFTSYVKAAAQNVQYQSLVEHFALEEPVSLQGHNFLFYPGQRDKLYTVTSTLNTALRTTQFLVSQSRTKQRKYFFG